MRFEVPQFIEIEDKIFGPFTWKQFVYLMGGIGVATVSYLILPFFLFVLIGVPITGLAFLLAFYPINNRPFSIFLESVFSFYKSNRIYYWKKNKENIYRAKQQAPTQPSTTHTIPKNTGGIQSLARQLELHALQKEE